MCRPHHGSRACLGTLRFHETLDFLLFRDTGMSGDACARSTIEVKSRPPCKLMSA